MRCIIAGFPFDLMKSEVLHKMQGIKPEPVTGESVIISRRTYPVKQVGQILTRQDRRDFTAEQITRAMTRLGFTCRPAPAAVTEPAGTASVGTDPATAVPSPDQPEAAMPGNHHAYS
ncbi:SCO5918 family protein [Streptomyces sp. RKAG293]|uniref:SCO5918 family protein n=1 Tax=Streptomyces sp. RKAG293 TaxID=2893403 RepID=UPI0020341054|nr:SCO5918 family protein [Streptomyces sp. RKAG293]MCM2423768.1 SCO5918 family protein [Streptomyces sp. RKAG293]